MKREAMIAQIEAMTVEDVPARRTRLLFLNAEAARTAAPVVAKMMASLMNKDEDW